ncbi:MAG: LysE family transporter, partial [Actinomycetota bacterium]|nr:LysE family transporter [Actinomycetota bacterium]
MDTVPAAVASFALVAGLVTVTPGLDTALVLRSAVTSGRRAYATGLGVCVGCLVWGVAAAAGLSALLVASEVAYAALRLLGGAYLLWLGLR